jgi:hypothetical protein
MPSLLFTGWLSTDNWTTTELSIESEFYVTTDGQPASLSWNKAPIWGLRPDLYYCQTVAGLLMWDALSEERTGLSFTIAAGPRQHSHSRVHFTVSDSRFPFSSPPTTRRATVELFYPAFTWDELSIIVVFSLYSLGTDHSTENISVAQQWIYANHIENTCCDTGSIVARVYCGRCLEMGLFYCWLNICCGLVYRGVP